MAQYVSLWLSLGEYQWCVGISMDIIHGHHTWPSKLALNGQFGRKFHLIWATLSHSMVGSLWSRNLHNMQKLAKPHQHVPHEILMSLSPKIIFIRQIVLVLSAFYGASVSRHLTYFGWNLRYTAVIWAARVMWIDKKCLTSRIWWSLLPCKKFGFISFKNLLEL